MANPPVAGVEPDIVLPSVLNYSTDIGEFARKSLPWDTIESARFERLDRTDHTAGRIAPALGGTRGDRH